MIQNITIGSGKNKKEVEFETDRIYLGEVPEKNDEIEKNARRVLGLPVTKQLVYYPNVRENTTIQIEKYHIVEVFSEFYTVEIILQDGEKRKILSAYLKEMQSPTFVSDMKSMEASSN